MSGPAVLAVESLEWTGAGAESQVGGSQAYCHSSPALLSDSSIFMPPMSNPVIAAVGAASEANGFAGSSKILKRRLNFATSRFILQLAQSTNMADTELRYDYL